MADFCLEEYFGRIHYHGKAEPTLETLQTLHRLHPIHIPYETIDILLGYTASLAPSAVAAKLINNRRGGGCFTQNILFKQALTTLGFRVESLICRSRFGRPPDSMQSRGHMALRVHLDGESWLADVGFGNWMLSAAVRFDQDGPQPSCFEPVRLSPFGTEIRLEALLGGRWVPLYDISPHSMHETDLDVIFWHANHHPDSVYRRRLMVSRMTADDRYALRDNLLTIRHRDGSIEQRALDLAGLTDCLTTTFGIPVAADWRDVLEAAVAADLQPQQTRASG